MTRKPPERPLRPEERDVWRQVARTAKPLTPDRAKALDADPAPSFPLAKTPFSSKPHIVQPSRAERKTGAAAGALSAGRASPGLPADRGAEKKVRRGRVEVEAKFDLHGLTAARARGALMSFLARCRSKRMRTVLVITGKGAGARALDESRFEPWSPDGRALPGVLRRAFTGWMAEPDFAALVSGYAPAHARHGGSGAFYVMLRA